MRETLSAAHMEIDRGHWRQSRSAPFACTESFRRDDIILRNTRQSQRKYRCYFQCVAGNLSHKINFNTKSCRSKFDARISGIHAASSCNRHRDCPGRKSFVQVLSCRMSAVRFAQIGKTIARLFPIQRRSGEIERIPIAPAILGTRYTRVSNS